MLQIPFEKQADGTRTCGAAAMSMVYRALGLNVAQSAIWRVIAVPDGRGGVYAGTYRLALDALLRGCRAVVVRAKDPIESVRSILGAGGYAVMNHQVSTDNPLGHFTVALGLTETEIEFHDPELGPSQRRQFDLHRQLSQPSQNENEVKGNWLVAVTKVPTMSPFGCQTCGSAIPEGTGCSGCGLGFPLLPAAALGCISANCKGRLWAHVACPFCDGVYDTIGA